jgi:uncharacterized protein YndB with AHSA1/START domain
MNHHSVTNEHVSATATISTGAEAVFEVLADPTKHAGIDGTGWVADAVDTRQISSAGQLFKMAMYHPNHPGGSYETVNEVLTFEPPTRISWRTGYVEESTGKLEFGGWLWRYDLTELGPDETEVRLTYDWSAVGPGPREYLEFPPFGPEHLANSLSHLAALVAS